MPTDSNPVPRAADDDEPTQPIPLQLIARLAAQDPSVVLKIGVTDSAVEALPSKEHEETKK